MIAKKPDIEAILFQTNLIRRIANFLSLSLFSLPQPMR